VSKRLRSRLARLERTVVPVPDPVQGPDPAVFAEADPRLVASELAAAFGGMVRHYRKQYEMPEGEAVARASEDHPAVNERALTCSSDQVSWPDLERLSRVDPALALRRWEDVREAALEELQSGHRAARALEGGSSDCWERARFLALYQELCEAWRPRDGQERQLVDMMAEARTQMLWWQAAGSGRAMLSGRGTRRALEEGQPYETPRLSEAEAVEEAGRMVERYQRLYLRALKALQDLRRRAPAVIVRRAGQVNIGQQQVNVAGR
jgi:hypothetical protein